MALKDTWRDKQNGVDDILAEDINSIAHATIDNENEIQKIKTPSVETKPVSLIGITTGGSFTVDITDNSITESVNGTYNIDFQGEARLKVKCESFHLNNFSSGFYIDDVLIVSGENYSFEWSGVIKQGIKIMLYDGTVTFERFDKVFYANGLMSAEQAEKLANAPTTEEVNNLIAEAFGTVEAVFDEVHDYAESLGGDEA